MGETKEGAGAADELRIGFGSQWPQWDGQVTSFTHFCLLVVDVELDSVQQSRDFGALEDCFRETMMRPSHINWALCRLQFLCGLVHCDGNAPALLTWKAKVDVVQDFFLVHRYTHPVISAMPVLSSDESK